MTSSPQYQLVLSEKFSQDLMRIAADARTDPSKQFLQQQVLREMQNLESGKANGHYALTLNPARATCATNQANRESDMEAKRAVALAYTSSHGRRPSHSV